MPNTNENTEINVSLSTHPLNLSASLNAAFGGGKVNDVQIDGTSIVVNKVANLVLGPGLAYDNGLTLDIQTGTEIIPKELTIEEQDNLTLLVENNGELDHTSINNLDYTKFIVQNEEDLSQLRINDFLFLVEE